MIMKNKLILPQYYFQNFSMHKAKSDSTKLPRKQQLLQLQ
jgi:hypothetical protein